MTNGAIEKAKIDLNKIISKYCLDSYKQVNYKKDGTKYKKHRQYSVPDEAEKALELLRILSKNEITIEQEEEIKAFLIPYRTIKTEYLV
jgi:hypothetical protein